MKPMRCPKSLVELRELPVEVKPNWSGVTARVIGAVVAVGAWLRVRAATRFLDEYYTVISGTLYTPRGSRRVPESLMLHEGVHDWQQRTRSLHSVRYTLSRRYRRHAEAQAYGLEVALGMRSMQSAARSMSDPIYAMGLSHAKAESWIAVYVGRWENDCRDVG